MTEAAKCHAKQMGRQIAKINTSTHLPGRAFQQHKCHFCTPRSRSPLETSAVVEADRNGVILTNKLIY